MMILHVPSHLIAQAQKIMPSAVVRGDLEESVAEELWWLGMSHDVLAAHGIQNRVTWENA